MIEALIKSAINPGVAVNQYVHNTGGAESPWNTGLTTALIGGAVGAGGLYGLGKLFGSPEDTDKRRIIGGAVLGGLGGLGAGYMAAKPVYNAYQDKAAQYNPYCNNQYPHIPLGAANEAIVLDNIMDPYQKAQALAFLQVASDQGGQGPRGLITKRDLVNAAIGAGLGYATGNAVGGALEYLFGLPDEKRRTLSRLGALGGLLINTGIVQ